MKPILAFFFILCVHRASVVQSNAAEPKRPNIIFLLADDQRADELGCMGHPVLKTPNLDRLAREGVLFENAFATSASCMPSRNGLLTGQWERRHTVGWHSGSALSREQWAATFPMVLKQSGYVTAYLGKNHTPGLRYWDFDHYYGNRLGHLFFYPKSAAPIFANAKADTQIEILGEGAASFLETDTEFVQRAGEKAGVFLRERAKDKPFLLYVCFNVPHSSGTLSMRQRPTDDELYRTTYHNVADQIPLPADYIAEKDIKEPKLPAAIYSGKQMASYDYRKTPETLREQRVRICQTVTGIDRMVGQIQAQLQQLGLAETTVIIYSSDHGLLQGEHGYGGKCLLYDPALRVPLIIHDPRLAAEQRGRRVKELVVLPDVAPTIVELSGAPAVATMQGRSLAPFLRGETPEWRRDFFCENLMLAQDYPLMQAVRSAEWKYIRYWPNGARKGAYTAVLNLGLNGEAPAYEELFHLTTDPVEQHNLAKDEKHQAQLTTLRTRCIDLLRETRGDPQTVPSTTIAKWMKEAPANWKDILPLLSKRGQAED